MQPQQDFKLNEINIFALLMDSSNFSLCGVNLYQVVDVLKI